MKSLIFCCSCVAVLLLVGCSTSQHYDWGNYENQLFNHFHKPEKSPAVLESMQKHVMRLESRNRVVPPGLYAELGTLYLQQGDPASAINYYEKERTLWPESEVLMTSLIQSLNQRENSAK